MSKKPVQETENGPAYIGHITTPVYNVARVKEILDPHGVTLFKCKGNDNWWTLVLPLNSMLLKDNKSDMYIVVLPDDFRFKYLPPTWYPTAHRDRGEYKRYPAIEVGS